MLLFREYRGICRGEEMEYKSFEKSCQMANNRVHIVHDNSGPVQTYCKVFPFDSKRRKCSAFHFACQLSNGKCTKQTGFSIPLHQILFTALGTDYQGFCCSQEWCSRLKKHIAYLSKTRNQQIIWPATMCGGTQKVDWSNIIQHIKKANPKWIIW